MRLYKVKITNKHKFLGEFIRFAYRNKIDVIVSYQENDMFDALIFIYVVVPAESVTVFEGKYNRQIIENENL